MSSQYRQNIPDTGEVARRIAYFNFRPVENTTGNLSDKCIEKELHLVLMKMLIARREMLKKFGDTPFFEWDIPYFENGRDSVLLQNNMIWETIDSNPKLRIRKNGRCNFEIFKELYNAKCDRKKKLTITDAMFAKMNLSIHACRTCKDCGKEDTRNCCENYSKFNTTTVNYIHGLHLLDEANAGDSDDDTL